MSMPFAQALYDRHFGDQQGTLLARNGEETVEQSVDHYFEAFTGGGWIGSRLDGPLLDLGAGAGRHALYFQEGFETVAIDQSELLVEVMRDRFASALAIGTQVGLAGSMPGVRQFLDDLAFVTTPDATAVVDGYAPEHENTKAKLDYRADPAPGLAYRVLQLEYDGTLGEPWLYRLFTPDRLRDAVVGTGWEVATVKHTDDGTFYNVTLRKR